MAVLQSSTRSFVVPCRCLIGRSSLADLRLSSRRASSEHATLGWYGGRWVLRDLGSSNGTVVDGTPLRRTDRTPLTVGTELRFGDNEEKWTVVDLAPPEPCAVLLGPQQYVWGRRSLLVLPSPEAPEASVFLDNGRWHVDCGTEVMTPECGDVVRLPFGYFRLLLPEESTQRDARTASYELDMAQLTLRFQVNSERVLLTLVQGAHCVTLPARSYLFTLLRLARLRVATEELGADAGWISAAELAEQRGSSQEKVNVDIHRLRKLLQDAGVHNAAQIIERDDQKRVRIGVSRIEETRD